VKRLYETCVVLDGTLPDEALKKEQEQVEQFIGKIATLQRIDVWGRRQLAYEIRRKKTGVYWIIIYEAEGDVPIKIDHNFRLNPNIIRFLTVLRDPNKVTRPTGNVELFSAPVDDDRSETSDKEGE
jgi:small subunit ribosomal protein S6